MTSYPTTFPYGRISIQYLFDPFFSNPPPPNSAYPFITPVSIMQPQSGLDIEPPLKQRKIEWNKLGEGDPCYICKKIITELSRPFSPKEKNLRICITCYRKKNRRKIKARIKEEAQSCPKCQKIVKQWYYILESDDKTKLKACENCYRKYKKVKTQTQKKSPKDDFQPTPTLDFNISSPTSEAWISSCFNEN